jgi:hypothetical protein
MLVTLSMWNFNMKQTNSCFIHEEATERGKTMLYQTVLYMCTVNPSAAYNIQGRKEELFSSVPITN